VTITWTGETSGGDWLRASGASWSQVVRFGPAAFEAYARLRFIPDPDPERPGQTESDVELPDLHPSELDQVRLALRVLAPFTYTPHDCWFAVWDGWGDGLEIPGGLPLLELPHRRYGLLRGSLDAVDAWQRVSRGEFTTSPAFVWPEDRRWCLAGDVDPHWAGIGADEAAIRALLAEPRLDVVRADPAERQPSYC
jgi:hypothetical protein